MRKWIHAVKQVKNEYKKSRRLREGMIGILLFAGMLYLFLFAGERVVAGYFPMLEREQKSDNSWETGSRIFMRQLFPVMAYAEIYGNPEDYLSRGNSVPEYFYQDDETGETQGGEKNPEETATEETLTASVPAVGNGRSFSREQLSDFQFLIDNCYIVDSTTYVERDEMNADTLLSMDMTMQQDDTGYQILIYHTHSSSEMFADSRPDVLEDTPIGLGDTLTELLEGYGYRVYHDRTVYDRIDGKVDRNYAYTASGEGIDRILAEHPEIEVVIDLHRDGLNENTHLVTNINGKPTAKIMFFNGVSRTVANGELEYLANPNRQANLAFSLQLYLEGTADYPDFLRRTYIKGYQYNLDRRPKATLIEVGGQTNTLEEARNAMEPLAYILHRVLSGESRN